MSVQIVVWNNVAVGVLRIFNKVYDVYKGTLRLSYHNLLISTALSLWNESYKRCKERQR